MNGEHGRRGEKISRGDGTPEPANLFDLICLKICFNFQKFNRKKFRFLLDVNSGSHACQSATLTIQPFDNSEKYYYINLNITIQSLQKVEGICPPVHPMDDAHDGE